VYLYCWAFILHFIAAAGARLCPSIKLACLILCYKKDRLCRQWKHSLHQFRKRGRLGSRHHASPPPELRLCAPMFLQVEGHPYFRNDAVIEFCRSCNIHVTVSGLVVLFLLPDRLPSMSVNKVIARAHTAHKPEQHPGDL